MKPELKLNQDAFFSLSKNNTLPISLPIKSKKILRKFEKGSRNREILTKRISIITSQVKSSMRCKIDTHDNYEIIAPEILI